MSDPDTGPITSEEMVRLFGRAMPVEAVELMWRAPPEKTVGEIRAELRAIAARRCFICGAPATYRIIISKVQVPSNYAYCLEHARQKMVAIMNSEGPWAIQTETLS